jgi:hypothetical protein
LAAGGTVCEPSGEIRNISVDGYGHTLYYATAKGLADLRSRPALRGRVRPVGWNETPALKVVAVGRGSLAPFLYLCQPGN